MSQYTFEDLISLDDAAKLLGIQKSTLLKAIQNKELQASEIGRGKRTTKQWLQDWVDSKTIKVGGTSADGSHS